MKNWLQHLRLEGVGRRMPSAGVLLPEDATGMLIEYDGTPMANVPRDSAPIEPSARKQVQHRKTGMLTNGEVLMA